MNDDRKPAFLPRSLWPGLLAVGLIVAVVAAGVVLKLERDAKLRRKGNLQTLGLYYHTFVARHDRGPVDLDDFRQGMVPAAIFDAKLAEQSRKSLDTAFERIESGEVVLVWGGDFGDRMGEELENYVLGYEKQVPDSGGWVLRGGGSVREMTPDQFAKLPKLPVRTEKPD